MLFSRISADVKVALIHLIVLYIVSALCVSSQPNAFDPNLPQLVFHEVPWPVIWILIFPVGYSVYLIPKSWQISEEQAIEVVLFSLMMNSCLWGYFIVRVQRQLAQWIRLHRRSPKLANLDSLTKILS